MSILRLLRRAGIDLYALAILGCALAALALPATGSAAPILQHVSSWAIALLFFLYGLRLSPQAALAGARHWRLHVFIFSSTFGLFPLLGIASRLIAQPFLPDALTNGLVFLACLPSTVQSSIAFTAIAGGNVAAALCSATASNLLGMIMTPLLVAVLIGSGSQGSSSLFNAGALEGIMFQLLLPFAAGQFARPLLSRWVHRHKALTGYVDRGSILLVVYGAFSEGTAAGVWKTLSLHDVFWVLAVDGVLLALVLYVTWAGSLRLGFSREDATAAMFCGSKKSLASGLPIATLLFPVSQLSLLILPTMLFHQIQLMACAMLARRLAQTHDMAEQP